MKNTDFPAFPSEQGETQDGTWNQTYSSGMSMRDYFAAKAMQMKFGSINQTMPMHEMAQVCYQMADAMIAARV